MPVAGWVFLAIFILFVVGGAAFVVASDRKRNPFLVTEAELREAPAVVIESAPVEAVDLASAAIQTVHSAGYAFWCLISVVGKS